jgi:protoporphyrin/coproporphyrin ferrochelatase
VKIAIVLFNLGGPDNLDAVRPFLRNLFSDPAIIRVPSFLRAIIAWFIAYRRAPIAREIYSKMGGGSPLLPETKLQAQALEAALGVKGIDAKCFIAMRYWRPFTAEAAAAVKAYSPDKIVLLPLYPQYSTTTTQSSRGAWAKCTKNLKLDFPTSEICCYPTEGGFIAAMVARTREAMAKVKPGIDYRVLFSAHGLPKKIVEAGDPYQMQVEMTAGAIVEGLGEENLDWSICYQSRVGPLEWIGPSTESEIERAGKEGKGLVVVPVAFVSEHSETLVELDLEYAELAKRTGVPDYLRAATVRDHPEFIAGLAGLVSVGLNAKKPVSCIVGRLCPRESSCGQEDAAK